MKNNVDLVLDNLFKEHYGKNKMLFTKYQELYSLPIISSECNVSKKLFEYCLRKKYFVLLLVYDETGKVFLSRVMSDILEWGLPGGSIKDDETINDCLNRISKEIHPNIEIDAVEPMAMIQNTYKHGNQEYIHYGLGFIAKLRKNKDSNIDYKKLVGDFVEINEEEVHFINRRAAKLMIEKFQLRYNQIIKSTKSCFQEEEIITNSKYNNRYRFHDNFVKKYILTNKLRKKDKFKKMLFEKFGDAESIIDVSCGDNKLVFEYGRNSKCGLVVGNDICWSQIEQTSKNYAEAIFTNHNAASLPFKKNFFDVAFCSNTLHHMKNKETLINVLEGSFEIAKKLVVVEIEDPKLIGGFPYLLHKYWYVGYLKDVGSSYLSSEQFKIIIEELFEGKAEIAFTSFKNVMGNYLIAEIIKNEE